MSTVHPDVCHGPDAKRLTQLALDARSALLSVKPPRLFGVERGADGIWTMKMPICYPSRWSAKWLPTCRTANLGFIREFTLIEVIENRIGWFTCRATLNPR